MDYINEKTTAYVDIVFYDRNGLPATPNSITYSTYCKTTGTPIKTNVSVAAASQITIILDALDSTIINTANPSEVKVLTVKASYNLNDALNSEYNWTVTNLVGV